MSPKNQAVPKQNPPKKKGNGILFYLFLIATLVCACVVALKLWSSYSEGKGYDDLAKLAGIPQNGLSAAGSADGTETEADLRASFQKLKELNPHFFGWVSIADTKINYPVVFTPDQPEYYLRRDFYGQRAMSGVPFLGGGCTENGNSFIIHGHNMNNGTMFADLIGYRSEEFWKEHPTIQFDTLSEAGVYEVMAAFDYDARLDTKKGVFQLYDNTGKLGKKQFQRYVEYAKNASIYDTGIDAAYGDTLLCLSTCSNEGQYGRFVVVARKKGPVIEIEGIEE